MHYKYWKIYSLTLHNKKSILLFRFGMKISIFFFYKSIVNSSNVLKVLRVWTISCSTNNCNSKDKMQYVMLLQRQYFLKPTLPILIRKTPFFEKKLALKKWKVCIDISEIFVRSSVGTLPYKTSSNRLIFKSLFFLLDIYEIRVLLSFFKQLL